MSEEDYIKLFHANVVQFLKEANYSGYLNDAMYYLGFIAVTGNDKLFPNSIASDVREHAKSMGIVNEHHITSLTNRKYLNEFITDSFDNPDGFVSENSALLREARGKALHVYTKQIEADAQLQKNKHVRKFETRDKNNIKKWQPKSKTPKEGVESTTRVQTEISKRQENLRDWGRCFR